MSDTVLADAASRDVVLGELDAAQQEVGVFFDVETTKSALMTDVFRMVALKRPLRMGL